LLGDRRYRVHLLDHRTSFRPTQRARVAGIGIKPNYW